MTSDIEEILIRVIMVIVSLAISVFFFVKKSKNYKVSLVVTLILILSLIRSVIYYFNP